MPAGHPHTAWQTYSEAQLKQGGSPEQEEGVLGSAGDLDHALAGQVLHLGGRSLVAEGAAAQLPGAVAAPAVHAGLCDGRGVRASGRHRPDILQTAPVDLTDEGNVKSTPLHPRLSPVGRWCALQLSSLSIHLKRKLVLQLSIALGSRLQSQGDTWRRTRRGVKTRWSSGDATSATGVLGSEARCLCRMWSGTLKSHSVATCTEVCKLEQCSLPRTSLPQRLIRPCVPRVATATMRHAFCFHHYLQ